MINLICQEINNYFEPKNGKERRKGHFSIINGAIAPIDFLRDGQYFRIIGSIFNDGVHIYPTSASELTDEEFDGIICPMAVPQQIIDLAQSIEEFEQENKKTAFLSESFGGYSYSKAQGKNGAITWQEAFSNVLKEWRKC